MDKTTITPERIRATRQRMGMSQSQFATRLGLAKWRESVSRLENGRRKPVGALLELLLILERESLGSPTKV